MKKLNYMIYLLIVFGIMSCKTRKPVAISKINAPDLTAVSVIKNDTLIKNTFDTLINRAYDFRYVADEKMKDFFKTYFIKDICEPGNYNNPIYKSFMEKGRLEADKALNLLRNTQYYRKELFGELNESIDFSSIRLTQVAVYIIAPNIVLYSNGQNIKQYYTLNVSHVTYRVSLGNTFIGLIDYRPNYVSTAVFSSSESLSYYNVLSLQKEPALFISRITGMKGVTVGYSFGYVQDNHIVFSRCSQGGYYTVQGGKRLPGETHVKECNTQTAEAYFSREGSGPSILTELIENAYKYTSQQ